MQAQAVQQARQKSQILINNLNCNNLNCHTLSGKNTRGLNTLIKLELERINIKLDYNINMDGLYDPDCNDLWDSDFDPVRISTLCNVQYGIFIIVKFGNF